MTKVKASYLILIFMIAFCMLPTTFFAQTKSTEIKVLNGKKYYIHQVEKGQSIYAISKTYSVDVNSILAENDDAIDGLKPGQELKIPVETASSKTSSPIDTNKYVYHKILKGETIYAITKKYNIDDKKLASYNPNISSGLKEGESIIVGEKKPIQKSNTVSLKDTLLYTVNQGETLYGLTVKFNIPQADIVKCNPSAKDGIKQGQVLKIPQKKTVKSFESATSSSHLSKDSIVFTKAKKTAYQVGLFLPFKLAESDMLNVEDLSRAKVPFPAEQNLALDFYFGFRKAVDSLLTKDFEINITLFDVEEKDSAKIEEICRSGEFKRLDVIFGPLYSSAFKTVSGYAKTLSIPAVSPLTQQNKILFNNPLTSKTTASQHTLIEGLADYCTDSLLDASNIIVVNVSSKDIQYLKTFKSKYNQNLIKKGRTLKDSVREVRGIAGVKAAFVPGKQNVIVVFTNNHVYLQDFITQLASFSEKKDIVLLGFQSVSKIDNLDQEYLNKLQFHFASSNHLDYSSPLTKQLVKDYQDVYFSDPSDYYFQAYDIGFYYLSHLKNEGPQFFLNLDKLNMEGVFSDFKFYRPDNMTGFENKGISIYKYSNYKLQRTGWK